MIASLKLIVLHPRLQKEVSLLINFGPSGVDENANLGLINKRCSVFRRRPIRMIKSEFVTAQVQGSNVHSSRFEER